MEIFTRKEQSTLIIGVTGRMDAATSPQFEKSIGELIAQGESVFLIDFSGLDYISSAGLRSLLIAAKQLKAKKGELAISGLKGPVKEVFTISGFYSLFKIIENETTS
jgi:anti-anti-sigma factor